MGFFNETEEEKKFRELLRVIRISNLDYESTELLTNYVSEIRDGRRVNDFYDFEMLQGAILEILNSNYESKEQLLGFLNKLTDRVRFLLPQGTKTDDYERIKEEIINYHCSIERLDLFDEKLYSLFDNRRDYLQIMDIIMHDENLVNNFSSIVNFAVKIGAEEHDQGKIKREIIKYLLIFGSLLSGDESYLERRIEEVQMSYGVYPGLDEKAIALIHREVEKSEALLTKIELLESKIEAYLARVDVKTKTGIESIEEATRKGKSDIETYATDSVKKMQEDLANSKKDLEEELNKFLASLEETMKNDSDQVFNQIMIDAREKVEQIRLIAGSLSGTTTKELLRIQRETEASLDKLKSFAENNPEVRESLKVAEESEELRHALIRFNEAQSQMSAQGEGVAAPGTGIVVPGNGIVVPSAGIVVPQVDEEVENFLVPKFEMTTGILTSFDRSIAFNKRWRKIEERIKELESQGYIIPKCVIEALPWYLRGKKIPYFYGPAQSGKTTAAELLTKIVGTELLDGGKITDSLDVTSYNDVQGRFDENALFYALYYGKTIFYDEIDNGNPDNLVVLGTFYSKLVNKIDNPDREVLATFAKRRFVPVNANARIVAAGNTEGKGRNRQYSGRSKFDESTNERIVPIEVDYDTKLEEKIFGNKTAWIEFFNFFREQCLLYAINSGNKDACEGNVTTGDAATIVAHVDEGSLNISQLIKGIFVQTKEADYLDHLIRFIREKFNIPENIDESLMEQLNKKPLSKLNAREIAAAFVYEADKASEKGRTLAKRR